MRSLYSLIFGDPGLTRGTASVRVLPASGGGPRQAPSKAAPVRVITPITRSRSNDGGRER
jgi:hypothetical protein